MSSFKKKSQNKRKKKKTNREKPRKAVKIIALIVLIIGVILFAMVSPMFNIETIVVEGNDKLSSDTIISLSGLQEGKNIFQFLKSEIIENIKQNQYVENVEIKRTLPGTVEITIEEREVAYQVKVISSYVYLDYQGYILEVSSEKAKVPLLSGLETEEDELLNGTRISSNDISQLNTILKIVENAKTVEIYDMITEIIIENDEYILYLKDEKKYIYLGDSSEMTNKMLWAQIIIESEEQNSGKAMINGDLSEGFRPYFSEEDID